MSYSSRRWYNLQWVEAGISHRRRDEPCQDVVHSYSKGDCYGYALSDGAGSCLYAREAAEECCRIALRWLVGNFSYLKNRPLNQLKRELFYRLYKRLHKKARRYKSELKEWGCTLLLVVHDESDYVAVHIGDGLIVQSSDLGVLRAISLPENGTQSNVTYFLTSKDAFKHLRFYRGRVLGIEHFILMSDGMSDALWVEGTDSFAPALYIFLDWITSDLDRQEVWRDIQYSIVEIVQQISSDDCSLLVACQDVAL